LLLLLPLPKQSTSRETRVPASITSWPKLNNHGDNTHAVPLWMFSRVPMSTSTRPLLSQHHGQTPTSPLTMLSTGEIKNQTPNLPQHSRTISHGGESLKTEWESSPCGDQVASQTSNQLTSTRDELETAGFSPQSVRWLKSQEGSLT